MESNLQRRRNLEQLENTQEILYENIDKKDLKEFFLLGCLVDVGVNLEKGTLSINGKEVIFPEFSNLKNGYRFIYFIKEHSIIGNNRKTDKIYVIGIQTTINKQNKKILIELQKNKFIVNVK